LHELEPFFGALPIDRVLRCIEQSQHPASYLILLVGRIGEARIEPILIALRPTAGVAVDAPTRNDPQPTLLHLSPAAARLPFFEILLCEIESALSPGLPLGKESRRPADLCGHHYNGAQ